jgi:hypothetical protein
MDGKLYMSKVGLNRSFNSVFNTADKTCSQKLRPIRSCVKW